MPHSTLSHWLLLRSWCLLCFSSLAMPTFKAQRQNHSSSPSPPPWFTRRDCTTGAAADRSLWHHHPTRHVGGGRGSWAWQCVSPFERSDRTATAVTAMHQVHRTAADHMTDGRNYSKDDRDEDGRMCDDDAGDDVSLEDVTNSRWLRDFLLRMAEQGPEEINDPMAASFCPVCMAGPGQSMWYGVFQVLLDHARSVRTKRVRPHRRFAAASAQATASTDAEWLALVSGEGAASDRMVLWPPMVLVLNTRLGKQEDSGEWLGMGNRELLDCFKDYEPVKARNAYGFNGHCGVSLLIFDGSVLGYHQAEQLHNHFIREGRGKSQWHKQKPWKQTTGKRLLYGYMATKEEELAVFNCRSGDKNELYYGVKPYQIVVGDPLKEVYESIQTQESLERDIARAVEQSQVMDGELRQDDLEIDALRRRHTEQSDEQNCEIKSYQELILRQSSELKESELAPQNIQEQLSESGSSVNLVGGEHDEPEYGKHNFQVCFCRYE